MLFGEIVSGSTRALINDEYDDDDGDFEDELKEPQKNPFIDFNNKNYKTPDDIDNLVFIEATKKGVLFKLDEEKVCYANEFFKIYEQIEKTFVIVTNQGKNYSTGLLTEAFIGWILCAKNVFAFTLQSLGDFQQTEHSNNENSLNLFTRVLAFNVPNIEQITALESPNLITGLGAQILSFCIHLKLPCALFVLYVDHESTELIKADDLKECLTKVGLKLEFAPLKNDISNNLYL